MNQKKMMADDQRVLGILARHQGVENCISAEDLASAANLEKRHLRIVVNRLIFDYGLQVGSSLDRNNSGYYMIETAGERRYQKNIFNARARTSLKKAALVSGETLLETAVNLIEEGLENGDRVEGVDRVLIKILKLLTDDPIRYAKEIKVLQRAARPLLVDRKSIENLNSLAAQIAAATSQALAVGVS